VKQDAVDHKNQDKQQRKFDEQPDVGLAGVVAQQGHQLGNHEFHFFRLPPFCGWARVQPPGLNVVMLDSAVLVPKPPPRAAADDCLLASFIR
jgi:hypothetical protein